ncbi:MAG: ArsR family transcriptional regulator [Phycicoccus sp.]|nr:ArsR family transcriptional regulator [Phycicoccus sp.]NMM32851.1 ArsR family transcriptional regulator [Phycicoccus sp.]
MAHLSTARARILDVLIDQPEPCTVAALSELIGQHPNTIREHLDILIYDRLVLRSRSGAPARGRPAWLYCAAPDAGTEPASREYAALASALAGQIARTSRHPHADAIEAGRMWGRDLVRRSRTSTDQSSETGASETGASETGASETVPKKGAAPRSASASSDEAARREVIDLLEELGFAPTADARARVVKLHRCPLLEAAHQQPEVVCGVHLGIVRGALEELGNDPERTESTALQPFSEPGACRLDLLPGREMTKVNR